MSLALQQLFESIHWNIFSSWSGIWNNHQVTIKMLSRSSNQLSMVGDYRDYIIRNLNTMLEIKNNNQLTDIDMQMSFSVLNKSYTVDVVLSDLPPVILTHKDEVIEKMHVKRELKGKNRKNYGSDV